MSAGEWIGLVSVLLSILGGGFLFLNKKIERVEKGTSDLVEKAEAHTKELVDAVWTRAEQHFAKREDFIRMEGKIDLILAELARIGKKVDRDG